MPINSCAREYKLRKLMFQNRDLRPRALAAMFLRSAADLCHAAEHLVNTEKVDDRMSAKPTTRPKAAGRQTANATQFWAENARFGNRTTTAQYSPGQKTGQIAKSNLDID